MDHNMVLSYDYAKQKGGGDERMHLHRRPFRWPCRGIEAIHAALPDGGCPEPYWKPLNAAIGGLLTPYCSRGRQDDNQPHNDE